MTNYAEHLATLVVKDFAIDPATLTWIEHLPASEVQFSIVDFVWEDNQAVSSWWRYLSKEKAEELVGRSL